MHQRKPESFRKTTTKERMQRYFRNFQVKYSGRSQLEGDPRSVSALSYRSIRCSNISSTGQNNFTSAFPQPITTPKQRIGNFKYPTKKVLQQPDGVDPSSDAILSNNDDDKGGDGKRRSISALSGNPVPKWNRLHTAYSKNNSSKHA